MKNNPTTVQNGNYLYGLNTLRFLAAIFIIAMHIQNNQKVAGLPQFSEYAFLYKGAVSFFFTLSGFLITYIRVGEYQKTGTVNIKRFLSNRFARLAPLYYVIIAAGLLFYWVVVPYLNMESYTDYDLSVAIPLYALFLSNLANSMFHVGGALYVSWSIGVQEQFYWLLLPFMKWRFKQLPAFLITVIVLSVFFSIGNAYDLFGFSEPVKAFVHTLRFHYMAIGALLGYYLFQDRDKLLGLWIFSKPWLQAVLFLTLAGWYAFETDSLFVKNTVTLPLSLLYGWLIINVGANPKNIIKIDNKLFDWIGQRTFGVYMMHMFVVYGVSFFFTKTQLFFDTFPLYISLYYIMVFGITILLAHISFTYFELPIMRWHKKITSTTDSSQGLLQHVKKSVMSFFLSLRIPAVRGKG
jgi:peptidoglycan/LPS O-acetylase OafA/YrhL